MIDSISNKIKELFADIYFLLVLLICIILCIYKFPDFHLPYFSDELWVYGPAVRKMAMEGPSMLPSSLGMEDHWGHPMFFFFLGGLWGVVFGSGILSTHIFSATLSIILIITVYLFAKSFFGRLLAFLAVVIFSAQSIFHGQFLLVLPEVLLTIFVFLTIYFYIKNNKLLYVVFGALLVLTKETGVLLIGTLLLWHFIKNIFYDEGKFFSKQNIINYLIVGIPILFLAIHMLLLKSNYGWYIMPERVEDFEFTWDAYYRRIRNSFHYVFIDQGRKPLIIMLIVFSILFNAKHKIWLRILILAMSFAMIKIFFNYWKLPQVFPMLIVPLLFLVQLKISFWDIYKTSKKEGAVLAIFSIFTILYVLFSSAQFDSLRYLLCIIPIYIIMVLYFVRKHIIPYKKIVVIGATIVCIVFSAFYIIQDKNFGDDTNNYSDACISTQEAINYLQENNYYNHPIQASFLIAHALQRPLTGYSKQKFMYVSELNSSVDSLDQSIYIYDSTIPEDEYKVFLEDKKNKEIYKNQIGNFWIKIYKK